MWWMRVTRQLESSSSLDGVVGLLERVADAALPAGRVKDALHGVWLGHPTHPLLVALPIGLWSGASLLDLTGGSSTAARRLVGAGLLAAVPTAAAGLADWSEIGQAKRPKRIGAAHSIANNVAVALYAASWLARGRGAEGAGRTLALLGAGALSAGGYLGGHLAYTQGIGVSRVADEKPKPKDWKDVMPLVDLPTEGGVRVQVSGQDVALFRVEGRPYAISATCSHLAGPLEEGEVRDGCVVCPWHGSTFRLDDGSVARGPATAPQPSYETRVEGGVVQVRART